MEIGGTYKKVQKEKQTKNRTREYEKQKGI